MRACRADKIGRDGTPSRGIQFGVRPCPAVDVLRTAGIVHAKDERVLEIQPGDRATRTPGEQTFQDGSARRVRIPQFARMNPERCGDARDRTRARSRAERRRPTPRSPRRGGLIACGPRRDS